MTRTYVLTVREAPKSNNRPAANRNMAHAEKKRWQGLLLSELMVARVERGMTFVTATVEVRWRRRNHQDIENFHQAVSKPLADALVSGGYLKDDTQDWFKLADMTAIYPKEWPHKDPRSKAETVIRLDCEYPE